jgi:hypothetical protein
MSCDAELRSNCALFLNCLAWDVLLKTVTSGEISVLKSSSQVFEEKWEGEKQGEERDIFFKAERQGGSLHKYTVFILAVHETILLRFSSSSS